MITRRFILLAGLLLIGLGLTNFAFAAQSDSLIVKVTVDILAPAPPTGLTALPSDTVVDLNWNANSEPDLAGYNLYRSTVSSSGYIKINASLITTATYQDTGLINGTTYYYVVTTVDRFGNESNYSNEANATPQAGEVEPNDNFATANIINLNSSLIGTFNPNTDQDYFKVTATQRGKIYIYLTNVPSNINAYLYLYDGNQNYITFVYSGGLGNNIILSRELTIPGNYYIRIFDSGNNAYSLLPYNLRVDFKTFWIYNLSDSPDPFSPNADGKKDNATISASITATSNWTLNIKDSAGVVKRTFTGTGTSIQQIWDGKDASGLVVADGTYTYTIDATDPQTGSTAIQVQGQVTVDNTSPTASITEPSLGATLTATVAIRGIADDSNFYYAYLYYGVGTAPTQWYTLRYISSPTGPNPGLLHNWNTSQLTNGDYVLRLRIYDDAGNTTFTNLPVKLYNITIYSVSDSPDPFSPNADGVKDTATIRASITANSNWTLNIKDSTGVVKRTFTGTGTSINQIWDGKDASGVVVADGTYTYTIDAIDPVTGSSATQVSGQVTVDNTLPTLTITEPASGATLSGTVAIRGVTDDINFDRGYLWYGRGASPTSWNYMSSFGRVGPSPGILANWNTSILTNDDYALLFNVYDRAGNIKILKLVVKLYNITIYNLSDTPDPFSPNADGVEDTATIRASITANSNWTLNIKDSTGAIKRTYTGTGTSINQIWDGKDAQGVIVSDGIYTYTIDATDPVTGSSATQVSGQVTVDNTLPTASITEPTSGATLTATVAIRGIADDTNFNYAYLYYGVGTAPTQWYTLRYISSPTGPNPGLLYSWNTSQRTNGDYLLKLEVFDDAGNKQVTSLAVKLYNVTIYNLSDTPDPFSPNSDGKKDNATINASITGSANWTVEIKDQSNNLIRTYTGSGNKITQIWDGKNSAGQTVTDGKYKYTISAVDPTTGTNALPVQGEVTVDNTKPTALISQPTNNQQISGIFDIKGLAKDLNYYGYNYQCFLAYGEGANPTSWKVVKWLYQSIVEDLNGNPSLIYQWNTTKLPNGTYTLHLSVMDAADNLSEVKLSVNLYNVEVIGYSDTPDPFSPNNDGKRDTTTISATLTMPANWTIRIKDSNNNIIRTFMGTSSTISQIWDGKDSSDGVATDGIYTYTIDTNDPATGTSGVQVSGNITLDTTNPTALISQPQANQIITGAVDVNGLAKDLNYDGGNYQCYLAYAKDTTPSNWRILKYLYSPVIEDPQGNPSLIYSWDTSSLANGNYTLRLLVTDAAENTSEVLLPVRICKVNNYYAEPALFSPNSDGVKDTTNIIAVFSALANWTISIKNSTGTVLRTFSDQGSNLAQVWDGKDSSGIIVGDGIYTFDLNATDPTTAQNILTGSGNIEVDNTLPTANITQPTAGSQVGGTVTIRGLAFDLHFDGSKSILTWGEGTSPTKWNKLRDLTSPITSDSKLTYWDTAQLKSGSYTLRLLVYDLAGNVRDIRVPVSVYNVRILSYSDSPDPFTPDNDGDKDINTIIADLSMSLNWKITITDMGSNVIRQFNGSGDTISQIWDGKNTSGQIVSDGVYNYKIEATDLATGISASPAYGTITVDTALPIAIITSPAESAVVGNTVTIIGTASDNNLTNYKVEYGQGETPSNWKLINTSSTSVTNGVLATWDSTKVTNGLYILKLTVTDVAGHIATAQVKVTVDNIKITNITISPDVINPYNNETTTINYTVDRDANITLKLYDLDNNLKRTLISAAARMVGANSEVWDGKDDSGVIVPYNAYTITIEAQSGSARGWYQSTGGFVHNAITVSGFSFIPNFNPYNNELCRIEYTLPANALFLLQAGKHEEYTGYISIIDWEIRSKGNHIEYWDGRDRKGDILDYYTANFPIILGCQTKSLPENSIVVTGMQLGTTDILSDPYAFMPSFGEFTNISFTISLPGTVSLSINKPSGELVKTLLNNVSKPAGTHTLTWDGTDTNGKIVDKDDDYIIKVDFTGSDGKTITRYGNITTR